MQPEHKRSWWQARECRDWTEAERLLKEEISRSAGRRKQVLQSQYWAMMANSLSQGPFDSESLLRRIQYYVEAANASPSDDEGKRHKHNYLSDACKLCGMHFLRQTESAGTSLSDAARLLTAAATQFSEALGHARAVMSLVKGDPSAVQHNAGHIEYLTYWHEMSLSRVHLLAYGMVGDKSALKSASMSIRRAITSVESLITHGSRENDLFPNRFYSIKHLRLELLWIDALLEYSKGNYAGASLTFAQYVAEFPEEHRSSWWHLNATVRAHAARLLAAREASSPEMGESYRSLCVAASDNSCGHASLKLAFLMRNYQDTPVDTLALGLRPFLMIDSRPEPTDYLEGDQFTSFKSLPMWAYEVLSLPSYEASSFVDVVRFLAVTLWDYRVRCESRCSAECTLGADAHDLVEHGLRRLSRADSNEVWFSSIVRGSYEARVKGS